MKTKSIMLIAVSLGFGLIAAIGMSQVLGQKSSEEAPEVEMVQVYVASRPLEIGEPLKLDENLNVKKRPITDVPENAIRTAEALENMIAIQKVPKDVLIMSDFIMDKHVAGLGKQPPPGFRAFTIKTELVDTHHNSIQAGDRIDIVGVFKVKSRDGKDARAPSTFLKNIEVWQVNDKDYIGVDGEANERISTITVLLTPKQVEVAILAQDIASVVRVVKTNRESGTSNEEDFDLASLVGLNNGPENDEPRDDQSVPAKGQEADPKATNKSQELLEDLNKNATAKAPKPVEYKHKMTIYKGGQVIKYGFGTNDDSPTVISQSGIRVDDKADEDSKPTNKNDFTGLKDNSKSDQTSGSEQSNGFGGSDGNNPDQ